MALEVPPGCAPILMLCPYHFPQSPVPRSKSRPIRSAPIDAYAELILDSVPHVVWTASADGVTTSLNRRGMAYTGSRPGPNCDGGWLSRAHPDDRELAREAWAEAVARGTDYAVEYRFRRFDGVYRWHSFRAEPVRGSDGEVAFWIGTATDIDDQRKLELSLRKSEKEAVQALTLLESIGDAAPVGFKLVDRDLRIVRINKRLAEVDGRTVSEQSSDALSPKWFRTCGPSSKMCTAGFWPARTCPTSC